MKLKEILEDFVKVIGLRGEYYEIFVNPTFQELKDLSKAVRFITNKERREVYVADSMVIHEEIMREIIDKFPQSDWKGAVLQNLFGIGKNGGGEVEITRFNDVWDFYRDKPLDTYKSDKYDEKEELNQVCLDIVFGEYDWLERYNFNINAIRRKAEDKLDKIEEDA